METVILHWAVSFFCGVRVSPLVLLFVLSTACLALMRFDDWYVLSRAARRRSNVEDLEALFDLQDNRGIGHPRVNRLRGSRG
jgi:hypothetical protein